MANRLYASARQIFLGKAGQVVGNGSGTCITWDTTDTIKAIMVNKTSYNGDAQAQAAGSHFLSEIPGGSIVGPGAAVALTSLTNVGGTASAASPIVFSSGTNQLVDALVLYKDTTVGGGSSATSPLIAWYDGGSTLNIPSGVSSVTFTITTNLFTL